LFASLYLFPLFKSLGIMAKLYTGLFGPVVGNVGNLIGGTWKGIPYLRTKPRRPDNYEPTPAQRAQQQRFKLATSFAQPLTGLLNVSYAPYAIRMTSKNAAISTFLKYAIEGTAPNFQIAYNRVLISRGDLPGALDATAVAAEGGVVRFSWTNNGGQGMARNSDKALVAVYCPALHQCVYNTAAADRSEGTATINAAAFAGHTVHTWIGFISEDGQLVATSTYTGKMIVF
jgi:Family of unknown function (DUF6266)